MIEVIVERWTSPGGRTDHLWSVWRERKRIHMGDSHASGEEAEKAARAFCRKEFGAEPDKLTRL